MESKLQTMGKMEKGNTERSKRQKGLRFAWHGIENRQRATSSFGMISRVSRTNRVMHCNALARVITALQPSDRICAVSCRALEPTAACMQSAAKAAGIVVAGPIARAAQRQKRNQQCVVLVDCQIRDPW